MEKRGRGEEIHTNVGRAGRKKGIRTGRGRREGEGKESEKEERPFEFLTMVYIFSLYTLNSHSLSTLLQGSHSPPLHWKLTSRSTMT